MALIYEDRAGNRLYRNLNKKTGRNQYYAKNAEGEIVNEPGVLNMMRKYDKSLGHTKCRSEMVRLGPRDKKTGVRVYEHRWIRR